MFPKRIKIKWYRIIDSSPENKIIEGPQTKFCEKSSWQQNNSAINIGAVVVVGRGIKKSSFVNNLTKSVTIWNEPLRPINTGPIRLITNARSFLSFNTTNKTNNTVKIVVIEVTSLIDSNNTVKAEGKILCRRCN